MSADATEKFARDVAEGKRPAVKSLRLACERHLKDLEASKKEAFPYRFDKRRAARFFDFCRTLLRLEDPKGADGEIAMELTPFQKFVTGQLFGWVSKADGMRRFKECYVEISKSSGKSPLAAAMAIYMLTADGEPEALIQLAARDYAQTGAVAHTVGSFIARSPALSSRVQVFHPNDFSGAVYKDANGLISRIQRLAAPMDKEATGAGMSGPRPHLAVIDEFMEARSDAQYRLLAMGRKNRKQPLLLVLTNSGRTKESPAGRLHERALNVLERRLEDDTFLPIVIVADRDTKPFEDESLWPALHPDLGFLLQPTFLREEVKRGTGAPAERAEIERLLFGTWSPKTSSTLFDEKAWEGIEVAVDEWDDGRLEELPCFLGIDLSSHNDLTALAAVWVDDTDDENPSVYAKVMPILPHCDLQARYARERVPYQLYAEQGHLHLLGNERIEHEHIAWLISEMQNRYNVVSLAYDRFGITQLRAAMERRGVDYWVANSKLGEHWRGVGVEMVEHSQGLSARMGTLLLENSIRVIERWVANGNIRVLKNPLVKYHATAGSEVEYGTQGLAKNRRFVASNNRAVKNDCIVALTEACGAAQRWLDIPEEVRRDMFVSPEDLHLGAPA